MIDQRFFPHIVDLIFSFIPLRDIHVCRAVCSEWRDRVDTGLIRHVAVVFWPFYWDEKVSMITLRTCNNYNSETRYLCEEPRTSAVWAAISDQEEAVWRARLRDVEIVDFEYVGGRIAQDNLPEDVDSTGNPEFKIMNIALFKVLGLFGQTAIVRWLGGSSTDDHPLATGSLLIPSRLHGLEFLERVDFCRLGHDNYQEECTPSTNDGFAPMSVNLELGDGFVDKWDAEYDSDYSDSPNFTWGLPELANVLKQDTTPTFPAGKMPHVTFIIHGSQLYRTRVARELILEHFVRRSDYLKGWTAWIVGLELFLDPEGPSPSAAWEELVDKVQGHWRAPGRIEDPPEFQFLTHEEYRRAVNDPFLYRLRTRR